MYHFEQRRGRGVAFTTKQGTASGSERLWAREFARVEANEDVVVTAIRSNTLEVRPPSVEEGEQHVASLDRRLTKANSRLVLTNCRCAQGQHERLDVLTRMALHQRFVEASRPILTTRPHVRRDQSQRHPVVAGVGPQRLENGDRLFMLAVPVIRAGEFPLREKRVRIMVAQVTKYRGPAGIEAASAEIRADSTDMAQPERRRRCN